MDQIVLVCIISFVAFTLYGAAGFGASTVFHSIWSILIAFELCSSEMKEIVYYLNMMHLFVNVPLIFTNRKNFQWDFTLCVGIPWFGLVVGGTYVLELKKVTFYLKIILGCVLSLIFVQQLLKIFNSKEESNEVPKIDLRKDWRWLGFIGVFGGILQGLFGMNGPCAIIVLTCSDIHVKRWKGNFYAWGLPAIIFVLIKYSLPGSEKLFERAKLPYYFAMCACAILGGMFGDFLSRYLTKFAFQIIILALCFVGAIPNFTILSALKPHKSKIMIAAVVADTIILGVFMLLMKQKRKQNEIKEKNTYVAKVEQKTVTIV